MAKITKEMIARILAHVGGAANVAQAGNCMTRLRLTLRDESLADSAAIRQKADEHQHQLNQALCTN